MKTTVRGYTGHLPSQPGYDTITIVRGCPDFPERMQDCFAWFISRRVKVTPEHRARMKDRPKTIPQIGGTESYPGAAFGIIINKAKGGNNVLAGHMEQNVKNENG